MGGLEGVVLILVGGLGSALTWGRPAAAMGWILAILGYVLVETFLLGRGGAGLVLQAGALAIVCLCSAYIGRSEREKP